MMGSTPCGVSSVASLRGRATHAPADSQVRTERYDGHCYISPGRRPGAPKWVLGWAGDGERGGAGGVLGAALRSVRPCDHAATSSQQFLCDDVLLFQFIDRVVDFPVVRQLRVPTVQTVQQVVEILQVPFLDWLLSSRSSTSLSWRRCSSLGFDCSENHSDSPVAVH